MAVSDWSTTPNLNVTINGIDINEGCAPGNLNDALRNIMADVRVVYDDLPDTSNFVTASGGVFSGTQPRFTGRGAYLHHNDSANASGRVFVLPEGSANPTGAANGDLIFFFAP
jgi:hypothetical protein